MKVVQINSHCGTGSIGKICLAVSQLLSKSNIENYILYSRGLSDYPLAIRYSLSRSAILSAIFSRIFGNWGFNSKFDTFRLIRYLEKIQPDVVHIHNIHAHDCDFRLLFKYLKSIDVKIYYTFHDCWAFTGYCPYFDVASCNKWKSHCFDCQLYKKYSWFFDRSNSMFLRKKQALLGSNLTIITPSRWLSNIVHESFLLEYPTIVINNGIDLSVFRFRTSDFRNKINCSDKIILLGVANRWEIRKGLNTFLRLYNDLDSKRFQIVLIGTDKTVKGKIPSGIITIDRTSSQVELAEIYSAADVLINPTLEDNFPTVNIESIACGTPVITYNSGGSGEMLNSKCGIIVERNNYHKLLSIVLSQKYLEFNSLDCIENANKFNQSDRFMDYIKLYIQ